MVERRKQPYFLVRFDNFENVLFFSCLIAFGSILAINGCNSDEFECNDGECVHGTFRCDGTPDCQDHSDEDDCRGFTECNDCLNGGRCFKITSTQFICLCREGWTGDYCEESHQCNGNNPCQNGGTCYEDNGIQNCVCAVGWRGQLCKIKSECGRREFQCDDGHCIIERFRCNGKANCPDDSDEANCTSILPTLCIGKYEFFCDNYECIDSRFRCDGFKQCEDGSDEENCDDLGNSDNSSEGNDNYIYINSDYQTVTYTIICSLVLLVVVIVCIVMALHHYRRRLRYRYQLAIANMRRRQRHRSNIYVPSSCISTLQPHIDGQADPEQTHVLVRYSINNGVQIITLGDDRVTTSPSTTTNQSSPLSNDEVPPSYWDVVHADNNRGSSTSSQDDSENEFSDTPPPPYPGLPNQNQNK
ncbi:uncharacterized protein LOC144447911 isoform X2 [Glandiceps talaboti]